VNLTLMLARRRGIGRRFVGIAAKESVPTRHFRDCSTSSTSSCSARSGAIHSRTIAAKALRIVRHDDHGIAHGPLGGRRSVRCTCALSGMADVTGSSRAPRGVPVIKDIIVDRSPLATRYPGRWGHQVNSGRVEANTILVPKAVQENAVDARSASSAAPASARADAAQLFTAAKVSNLGLLRKGPAVNATPVRRWSSHGRALGSCSVRARVRRLPEEHFGRS